MYRKEDFESVIFYSDKVLDLDKSNEMAYYYKGRAQHKIGKMQDALNNFNTAINLNPDFGEAYFNRGAINLYLKRKSSACEDLSKAKSLNVSGAAEAYRKNCQ
jgi:tetratricopeptide (TPR) repeat protein